MAPQPPDGTVRLRLKCPDAEDFVERFAPNVTRGGVFLPTQEAREVGASIRFEIALVDDTVVFAGEGEVTWAKPKGLGVKFTTLDPAAAPMLERLLARREAPAAPPAPAVSAAPAALPAAAPKLFAPAPARLPPPAPPPKSPGAAPTSPSPPPPAPPPRKSTPPAAQVSLPPPSLAPRKSTPAAPVSLPPPAPPPRKAPGAEQVSLPPLPPPSRRSVASEPDSPPPPAPPAGPPAVDVPAAVPVADSWPATAPATTTTAVSGSSRAPISPEARRRLIRVAVAGTAVVAGMVVVWLSLRTRPVPAPAVKVAAAPPVAAPAAPPPPVAAPPPAAPEPSPAEMPPPAPAPPPAEAAPEPPASADPRGLRVENLLVGPSYKKFTCPNPNRRLSIRSTKTVNICMEVAHKPGRTDRLTLVWDRNGEFTSKTHVKIPASMPSFRTRSHMKISKNRLGPWTVRVLSARNAPLAETTFEVVR